MPTWHFAIFILAAVVTALMTIAVRRFVLKRNLGIVQPRARDVHTSPIPRLGGVAVAVGFLVTTLVVVAVAPDALYFIPETVLGIDRNLVGILAGVIILLLVGVVDDVKGMHPLVKLAFHLLAGVILASSLVLITHITNPFGGQVQLGIMAYVFVVLWVVFMINVINWLDGLDGLAGGISLIATVILYLLAVKPEVNQLSMSVLAIILAGSLAGFLPFNTFPAKIFLGDSGSQVLGFLLAVFAIISGGKLATAFLVLGVPILDVIWVMARRLWARQPVYKADRYHLHHRLLAAGLNQRQAVILLYTVSAAFGTIALQTQSMGKLYAALILVATMVIGGLVLVTVAAWRTKRNAEVTHG